MYKRTFTYVDYDGNQRKEDFYFYLSKAELTELELSTYGGLEAMIKRLIEEKNSQEIVNLFKHIILSAVGKKSYDGRRFEKSEEIRNDFYQTEAYSDLFCELVTNADKANEFLTSIIPQGINREAVVSKEEAIKKAEEMGLYVTDNNTQSGLPNGVTIAG